MTVTPWTRRRPALAAAGLLIAAAAGVLLPGLHGSAAAVPRPGILPPETARTAPANLYVDARAGSDTSTGTAAAPLRTLAHAMTLVRPGSTIHLAAGLYTGPVRTTVDGTATHPITVEGPAPVRGVDSRHEVVLSGGSHVFAVANSHWTLHGFTIDGELALEAGHPLATRPTTLSDVAAFKTSVQRRVVDDRLVYVDSLRANRHVTGTVISDMVLEDAGGECVHVRNDSTDTTITHTTIAWCGLLGKVRGSDYEFHNGEGVYVGTSPDSGLPADHTSGTTIVDDVIETYGSECVDVKEDASHTTFADSHCGGDIEPLSYAGSDVELRGYDDLVTGVVVSGGLGYGVKITANGPAYDNAGNVVTDTSVTGTVGAPLDVIGTTVALCGDHLGPAAATTGCR